MKIRKWCIWAGFTITLALVSMMSAITTYGDLPPDPSFASRPVDLRLCTPEEMQIKPPPLYKPADPNAPVLCRAIVETRFLPPGEHYPHPLPPTERGSGGYHWVTVKTDESGWEGYRASITLGNRDSQSGDTLFNLIHSYWSDGLVYHSGLRWNGDQATASVITKSDTPSPHEHVANGVSRSPGEVLEVRAFYCLPLPDRWCVDYWGGSSWIELETGQHERPKLSTHATFDTEVHTWDAQHPWVFTQEWRDLKRKKDSVWSLNTTGSIYTTKPAGNYYFDNSEICYRYTLINAYYSFNASTIYASTCQ